MWIRPRVLSIALPVLLSFITSPVRAQSTWSNRYGSALNERANAIAVDPSGNVIIGGRLSGPVNLGGGTINNGGGNQNNGFVAKYGPTGTHSWSYLVFGTVYAEVLAVTTDASGNVLVSGVFRGTSVTGLPGSTTSNNVFTMKLTAAGGVVWARDLGNPLNSGNDASSSIATDASGNVYVAGGFEGTITIPSVLDYTSNGASDVFVAKYNSSGTLQWLKPMGGTGSDWGYSVVFDNANGHVLTVGSFQGSVNFGGGTISSAGGSDFFMTKHDAAGGYLTHWQMGGTGDDVCTSMCLDASGNVLLTGTFTGTTNFHGPLVSAGGTDIFLCAYTLPGTPLWKLRFGGPGADSAASVKFSALSQTILCGKFSGTAGFGAYSLTSSGTADTYVARVQTGGSLELVRQFGGTADGETLTGLALSPTGAFVSGYAVDAFAFDNGNLPAAGGEDVVVANLNVLTSPWISSIEDIGNDQGGKVKVRFSRMPTDHPSLAASTPIIRYEAYRRDDAPPASLTARSGREQLLDLGWTQVGSVDAHEQPSYGIDVPTVGDSTLALGQYHSVFFVRAATADPGLFYDSEPDSGYSLDNLSPGIPLNFVYESGGLEWDEPSAADFDFFTVYGSNTDSFGSAVVVDYSVAPSMDVSGSPYVFYYVTATDFSGNEGKPAKVNTLSGVGGTPKSYVLSVSNYPNPFNPRTTVNYGVPSRGRVTVSIYDARGARVATLINGENRGPGAYSIEWDGRAEDGATVSSGVYFARIEHHGVTRSKKMMLLK